MALPPELLEIEEWARDGERQDPETLGLDRANGWPVVYEQIGGKGPEREVFNQLLFEVSKAIRYILANGLPPHWHQDVDYRHPAFCKTEDGTVYVSRRDSGPRPGNSTDPLTPGQNVWSPH